MAAEPRHRAAMAYLAGRHTAATNGELTEILGLSRAASVPNLTRRFAAWLSERFAGSQAIEAPRGQVDPRTSSRINLQIGLTPWTWIGLTAWRPHGRRTQSSESRLPAKSTPRSHPPVSQITAESLRRGPTRLKGQITSRPVDGEPGEQPVHPVTVAARLPCQAQIRLVLEPAQGWGGTRR